MDIMISEKSTYKPYHIWPYKCGVSRGKAMSWSFSRYFVEKVLAFHQHLEYLKAMDDWYCYLGSPPPGVIGTAELYDMAYTIKGHIS